MTSPLHICLYLVFNILLTPAFISAQEIPSATSSKLVVQNLEQKNTLFETSIVKNIPFKNVGPTVMSGRVVDVDVNPDNPTEFLVGYASGGVWHTINNGTSFTPLLDSAETQNVGDIAVDWKNKTIWVGTGENNASRSSYAGIGVLKSTDWGTTWTNTGLYDTQHISRILINPENPDEVVVAALGHLYSSNSERGVYKTIDGGKTWNKTLFVSDESGIVDLAASPNNFDILFASSWQKDRKAWDFKGNGSESGIYKSTDAGSTWTKVNTVESGFPVGEGVGRIGLAVFDDQTLYAVHDSQFRKEEEGKEKKEEGLSKEDFRTMDTETFLALDNSDLNNFLKQNNFQEKYRAENVKQLVRAEDINPTDLVKYLEDANSQLFDTPVIGAEVYRSNDGGITWTKMNDEYIEDLFYSYGYYFAQIRVDPSNVDKIYICGVPIVKSDDGGKTWKSINGENVHSDHHALWIDPNMSGHLINGNDGGVNISYDDGETWIKNNSLAVGQFYAIAVDNEKPYNIYGGLQDNGVWVGPHTAAENKRWEQSGDYPWKSIMGGDGMQVEVDNRNSDIVYTGYQFGNYYRINRAEDQQTYIQPKHELGESPYRFNWQTPILLSSHNQDILYLGGNKLHRSLNQGDDWETISDDLTKGGKKGNVAYGTLTTISESPFKFGLLYTGSDDGLIYLSKNAGGDWENISNGLPENMWVSRVVASSHKKSRVYATLNGYRWDDFIPYVYVSEDYGKNWKDLSKGLPWSPINVIYEDPEDENILYLGTDDGAYVSLNKGDTWSVFDGGLPAVAVHDIVVQKEEKDLVLGTHGRSIYVADTEPLHNYDSSKSNNLQFFEIPAQKFSSRWGSSWSQWSDPYTPEIKLVFFSPEEGPANISVENEKGKELKTWTVQVDKGFNYVQYDLTISEKGKAELEKKKDVNVNKAENGSFYLPASTYKIEISLDEKTAERNLEIKE